MTQLALVTLLALGAGTVYGKPWSSSPTTEDYSGDWSPDYTTEDYPWDNPNDWYTTGSPDWPSTSDVQNNWWPKTISPEP